MKKLSVIVVLYNEFEMVKRCIASVYKEKIDNMELILVDNSTDKEGHTYILKLYPNIRYIQNKENVGFGRAVNTGLKAAKSRFALILTPDTKVLPHTIQKTLDYIMKHDKVAMVGCRIYSYPKQFHLSAYHTFPNLLSHVFEYNMVFYKIIHRIAKDYHPLFYTRKDHQQELSPKHIIGGYMLLRIEALKDVGFFDNQFKMYREETDLCMRLYKNNWKIAYLPVGGLIHYGGSAWKKTTISQALPGYMESTYLFFKKYHGRTYTLIAWFLGLGSTIITIPFLGIVKLYKKLLDKQTQSSQLFPLWLDILKWHISKGIVTVFSI